MSNLFYYYVIHSQDCCELRKTSFKRHLRLINADWKNCCEVYLWDSIISSIPFMLLNFYNHKSQLLFFYLSLWGKLWSLFKIVLSMKDLFFQFSTYSLLGILFDFFSSSFYLQKFHKTIWPFWQLKKLDIWFWKNILQLCSTQMYALKYWNQYLQWRYL